MGTRLQRNWFQVFQGSEEMKAQLINCDNCQKDIHIECLKPESCLCAVETNHNEKIIEANQPFTPEQIARGEKLKETWRQIYKDQTEASQYKSYKNSDWTFVSDEIQENNHFLTIRETKKMWVYVSEEGVYVPNGETFIEEECQRLIHSCTTKSRNEIINTIRANKRII